MADLHNACAPVPPDVKEVLEKGEMAMGLMWEWLLCLFCVPGPKGPDGKGFKKLIEYFSSKDPHYVVEIRPNKRSQGKELGE